MPGVFLSEIILITVAAFIGGFLARTIKFPPVLGYIASGIVFGIIGKNIFQSYESLVALSEIGISLFLFTLGFEISLDKLKAINRKIFLIGIAQILLIAAFLLPIFFIFNLDLKVSILFSILASFSSTAVVVKILEEKGLLNDFPGNNVFILLLIQDLFVVPVIFLLPVIFSDAGISGMSIVAFIISAVKTMGIFIGLLIASRFLLSRFLNFLFRYPSGELTILATIFTAATAIYLFSSVGLPQTIAAFLAGVLISEQGKNLAPLTELRPFRDLFLVLFFVLTGMLLNFGFFIDNFFLIVAILAVIIIIKFMIIYTSLRVSRFSPTSSVFISSHLANIGEFSVVIAQIAFVSGFLATKDYNLILSFFILSLISIPVWTNYARGIAEKIARTGILARILPNEDLEPVSPYKFSNHVVICGHGRVGREVRALLDLSNIPYVVVDFNRKVINDLLTAGKYAIYGDPTDREILEATFIKDARVLVIAVPDGFSQKQIVNTALKFNPSIIIVCRTHVEDDRYDLINMGVNTIVVPELEAGLRIGHEVLSLFNIQGEDIDAHIRRLRRTSLL
ncbi:MAG: hypothetical protein A3C30_02050 [Candidatus Levybacteria bacterium RIFCSPHIGHO2_02_FULL_40_18]|nr:MAG: hypothetical protein A2869_04430 [Candidatus Levybacteria bacterium RIFCSPHIGHO2_01_FULL_40_58]OGH26772.1 MAG: hypothetical protein A3C30_02050 [Candidatus Levybacteria bacterium RIFCSPHIGHO2_02_FULL_40_18]OGH31707.1 MAG: hypothetical protein A3E43_01770 [Candidatus Levybacteria bacterium RIFCSPHIGHO2_12_FULL_40_31]OGH40607.1 MAG: hypothetical protein A2894_00320 [Candidatus Levybacteria bacterium RIFCSPLOWO2_01_FULL_40_64]OGH48780.1 MAG: hypothetical protein A3I54_03945 [Candidatus Lev